MENFRNRQQKVEKMKELGIFDKWVSNTDELGISDKWVSNTDERTKKFNSMTTVMQELNCVQRRKRLLSEYAYLSDMIEASFTFSDCPEGKQFWYDIVDELRREI